LTQYRVIVLDVVTMDTESRSPCPPKPVLSGRPLLSIRQAQVLEMTFKMLANATRLRMLHALARAGELGVSELADTLDMKPQAVSNQLQRLADRGIVAARRDGLQMRYSILDPCVPVLLHQGWCLAEDAQVRAFERVAGMAS
jgi:ArsR family transcriptional regulator, lead/cadmium/zinc/bismuth-responsive transcriptional repressor